MKKAKRPSKKEVDKWIKKWNTSKEMESYRKQEEAINEVFSRYRSNKSIKNILIKCSLLNDFYSTNIFKIYPVAKHIKKLNIDDKTLLKGDLSLVNKIAKNKISGADKNFYSFATKYCSHHAQDKYPIYDYYVDKMLREFRKEGFIKFKNKDLKNYKKFYAILEDFRKHYGLNDYSLRELDKYLWLAGKKYFQKKYKY